MYANFLELSAVSKKGNSENTVGVHITVESNEQRSKKPEKYSRDTMVGCCGKVFIKPATCLTLTAYLHLQVLQPNKAKERTEQKLKRKRGKKRGMKTCFNDLQTADRI